MTIVEVYEAASHDGGVAIYHDGHLTALAGERIDRIKHSLDPGPAHSFLLQRLGRTRAVAEKGVLNHPLAHAASAYYPSPHEDALIIVVDDQGSYGRDTVVATSVWQGAGLDIVELQSWPEPVPFCSNSLGHFYSAVTYYLGFDFYDQGKTMALASYGAKSEACEFFRTRCQLVSGRIMVDEAFVRAVFSRTYGKAFGWPETRAHDDTLVQIASAIGPMRRAGETYLATALRHCERRSRNARRAAGRVLRTSAKKA